MDVNQIIIEPVLTEKTNLMREGDVKKYVFRVNGRANKPDVIQAVKAAFSVNPTACRIITVKSKPRVSRTKVGTVQGRTGAWKKAIVTLKKGEKIEIFEGA
ncbi:MAG: 50S ribosomal protein L23 [Spirochaetales bacterium]|jgi:large subunit ribosomal protein L23|nr:50S ribosomal protein L23 [Spirochaetales bacterium]